MEDVAARTHAGFDLGGSPLIRAVLFDLGASQRPVLLLAVHHLVVDGVSWRILLEDLEVAYRQASGGQAIHLPAKTTSFRDWALRLVDHVSSGGLDDQLDWWAELGDGAAALPRDREGANTIASTRALAVHLDPDETRALLSDVPGVYRTQINDVLLAALGRVLSRFSGSDRVLVDLEGHGREEILPGVDLSRTVGWFTTIFPVTLDLAGDGGWASTLKSVKEQLRAVPGRGLGYGALRYLREGVPGAEGLAGGAEPEVSFNYLGQFDWGSAGGEGLVRGMPGGLGGDASPEAARSHVLGLVGAVQNGCPWWTARGSCAPAWSGRGWRSRCRSSSARRACRCATSTGASCRRRSAGASSGRCSSVTVSRAWTSPWLRWPGWCWPACRTPRCRSCGASTTCCSMAGAPFRCCPMCSPATAASPGTRPAAPCPPGARSGTTSPGCRPRMPAPPRSTGGGCWRGRGPPPRRPPARRPRRAT